MLTSHLNDEKSGACIFFDIETKFVSTLKKKLQKMNVVVTLNPVKIESILNLSICFIVQTNKLEPVKIKNNPNIKFIFIFFDNSQLAQEYCNFFEKHSFLNTKVINLETEPSFYNQDIETIFWHSFSRNSDAFVSIIRGLGIKKVKKNENFKQKIKKIHSKKFYISLGFYLILLSQLIFFIPLIFSSILNYSSIKNIETENYLEAYKQQQSAISYIKTAKNLYVFSAPFFHFISLGVPIENIIALNESASYLIKTHKIVRNNGKIFFEGLFNTQKTESQITDVKNALSEIISLANEAPFHLAVVSEHMPKQFENSTQIKNKIQNLKESILTLSILDNHIETILSNNQKQKYLILFANNMELRPGGGFIGSYATLELGNYTVYDFKVFDVYDADGQLTTRIEPPKPISDILNQPFWYLRDSAFSPDFPTNFKKAEEFLKIEMNEPSFEGGFLITTTAVKNILEAFKGLYIPDYNENITAENFYLKTQLQAEENFFPGSIQKKNFLSSILQQLIIELPSADPTLVLSAIQSSLNQKQIVAYSHNKAIQETFEKELWAGSLKKTDCPATNKLPCISDYLFQYDANLGVNKANFFVKKPTELNVKINSNGKITNTLKIKFINDSMDNVFPGGPYRNYFQALLPLNSKVKSIKVDNEDISDFDEKNINIHSIGFPIYVKNRSSVDVVITYELPTTFLATEGIYQLILQKQIGSPNYDFTFSLELPSSFKIQKHNLSPLVNTKNILYNTSISTDKIILIEFKK